MGKDQGMTTGSNNDGDRYEFSGRAAAGGDPPGSAGRAAHPARRVVAGPVTYAFDVSGPAGVDRVAAWLIDQAD